MRYMEVIGMSGCILCYTDAFLSQGEESHRRVVFISLFGRPALVKMASALLVEGRQVWLEDQSVLERPNYPMRTLTEHVEGGVCHKVMFCPDYFTSQERYPGRVVLGEDKEGAFRYVASITTTPLKREWAGFIWDNVIQKEPLVGFGAIDGTKLDEAYLVTLPHGFDLDEVILEALKNSEIE